MAAKLTSPDPPASAGLSPTDYALLAAWLKHTETQWSAPSYPRREQMRGLLLRLMVLARQAESGGTNTHDGF